MADQAYHASIDKIAAYHIAKQSPADFIPKVKRPNGEVEQSAVGRQIVFLRTIDRLLKRDGKGGRRRFPLGIQGDDSSPAIGQPKEVGSTYFPQ